MIKMHKQLVVLTTIFNFFHVVYAVPQVFSDKYNFCEYEFGNKKLIFPDKLWTIAKREYTLHFSFCKTPQPICRSQTSSCLIQKQTNQIIDLGHKFQIGDPDQFILESRNGAKCPNSQNSYSIIVTFECSDSIKSKPRLISQSDDNECVFEITMMRPDCRPKCTDLINGSYLLDIRNFPKNVNVQLDSRKFSFSVCGSNRDCGIGISSCEFVNNTVIPLAKIESQSLVYDAGKNELTARGRFKEGRVIREFQVLIKCNWQTEINNAKYKKVPTQGKNYKFELESSYGCVKLPQDCSVMGIDNLRYNLSNLYNLNGWQVANVPQGKMLLNICGPLKRLQSVCSDQYSQVCHVNNNNYINRGSVLSSLSAHNNVIEAVFSSGSTCVENTTQLYSTKIEFKCSQSEQGPIFKEYKECVTLLMWETPHACAVDHYKGQNCYMNDRLGNRNLKKLFSKTDKTYPLSRTGMQLVYNLCGPIHSTCNNYNNVSFCLKSAQNQEVIIGWDNREVVSENGLIRMELTGNMCFNRRSNGQVTIHFICSYEDPLPSPQIDIIEDDCKFNMRVFTPHACVSHLSKDTFTDCVYNDGNVCYDLSPLVYKSRNYMIPDQNVEYILNVCGPVVTGPGALCKHGDMICLRNKTELHLQHQYVSLGAVAGPKFENNSLIIESTMGTYCEGHGYYKSIIYFQCSQRKFPPQLLAKETCTYKFVWKTPEACPIRQQCVINSTKSESKLDLTDLEQKKLIINLNNGTVKYEFDLCRDVYTERGKDTTTYPLTREFYQKYQIQYLMLDLGKSCDNENVISNVTFEFECDHRTENYYIEKSLEDCHLMMIVRTRIACPLKKELDSIDSIETSTETVLHKVEYVSSLDEIKENKCLVVSQNTGYEFKISRLKSQEISIGKDKYALNFDRALKNCSGLLCKNNIPFLTMETCPGVVFNHTNPVVLLKYMTESVCNLHGLFHLEVWLSCNHNKVSQKVIKNETCQLIVEYSSPEACSLFPEIEKKVPVAAITGGLIGGLLVAFAIVVLYLNRSKCSRFSYINLHSHPKAAVPIYLRINKEDHQ